MLKTKLLTLFNIIIPISEFVLSILCIYLLFQTENNRLYIFSLFCIFILFRSFFELILGVSVILSGKIERSNESNNG